MTPRVAGPVGLGGWLWPVTWVSAMMPVLFVTPFAHSVVGTVARYPDMLSEYSAEYRWHVYSEIVFTSVGLCITVWWAMHWFARSPRLIT